MEDSGSSKTVQFQGKKHVVTVKDSIRGYAYNKNGFAILFYSYFSHSYT